MNTRTTEPNVSFRHSLRLVAVLLAILTLVPACSDLAAGSPLSNARKTPEALAEAALAAIATEDVETLNQLLVTRDEYETLLWPSLPDGDYVSFDFVWGMSAPRSRKGRRWPRIRRTPPACWGWQAGIPPGRNSGIRDR